LPYGVDNLVGIFSGYFGTEFINFADTVTTSLSTSNKDSVAVVSLYVM